MSRWLLELISGPEIEVVDLARMKRELREFASVTTRDDDITAKIVAGREWAEEYTGCALVDQTWRLTFDHDGRIIPDTVADSVRCGPLLWHANGIYLRRAPALSIVSVKTVGADGTETDVDDTTYELREPDSKWPRLVPLGAPAWLNANLRITFRAGFVDRTGSPVQTASEVPERFKQAIMLWVRGNYDSDKDYEDAAERLLKPMSTLMGFA